MNVDLRPMAAGDLAAVTELCHQLGYQVETAEIGRHLAAIDEAGEAHLLLVAESGEEVVAWVHAQEWHLLESPPAAEIGGLVVGEGQRGLGIGHALLSAVETWAAGRGLVEVRLRSNVTRAEAHQFYESRGYGRVKTSHTFLKKLDGT